MNSRIETVWHVKADAKSIEHRARGIAVEQSVEMPVEPIDDAFVLNEILGRVDSIREIAPGEYEVKIGLAAITTGYEAGQLINMILGNTSLQDGIALVDATFPDDVAKAFGGPSHGLEGLRGRVGASGALSATALKPQGSTPEALAKLAHAIALGGIDYIKDDHGIADQFYSPFAERVPMIAEAVHKAARQTGIPTRYLPSLNGNLDRQRRQIEICRANGVDGVLIAPMIAGFSQFVTLKEENPDFAFMTHPSLGGWKMDAALLFGKLVRMLGADATVYCNYGGRFGYSAQQCRAIANNALADWPGIKPCVPVPAGGMLLERIPELLDFFGQGVMLLIGGSLLSQKDKITDETRKFCDAVRAYR